VTRLRFAFLLLPLAVLSACGQPQVPPAQNYATIRGRAYDRATNAPVAGVSVTVDTILIGTTGPDGTYRIVNVPIGLYTLIPGPPSGYTAEPQVFNGSVAAGEAITVDIPLVKQ
jgi:hypothetical protein